MLYALIEIFTDLARAFEKAPWWLWIAGAVVTALIIYACSGSGFRGR